VWRHLLAWWPLLFGLWLLLAGSLQPVVLLVGLGASLACAVLAVALRRAGVIPFDPGPGWLLHLPRLGWHIVRESWLLAVHLFRSVRQGHREGSFLTLERRWTPGDPAARRERAWLILAMSLTPNTVVVGVDLARGWLLLHQLLPAEDAQGSLEALL
jgi:multisubunit Na+/H+ antiporter MnhE subunit